MNFARKTLFYYIIHTTIGIIALLFLFFGDFPDNYREGLASGIAGGFIITGMMGIFYSFRLMKDPKKAKEVEIYKNEERNQFIRLKTHSAIFTVNLYAQCLGILVAGFWGYKEISLVLAGLLVIQLIMYIGFANYYTKKY